VRGPPGTRTRNARVKAKSDTRFHQRPAVSRTSGRGRTCTPCDGHRSLNPARLPVPSRTLDTKCARQELNLHARNGHPGLSRARLPLFRHERGCHHCVVLKDLAEQRYWLSVQIDGATRSVGCKPNISAEPGPLQYNWVQRTTGMSDDIPSRANSKAEGYMRIVFRPKLPAGALAHQRGGSLAE
jgi:hypothetical protein